MVKEHIQSTDELLQALGAKPLSSNSLTLRQFKMGRPLTDLEGRPIPTYAKKRPLTTVACELNISIHKLRRMIKVLRKEGPDGLSRIKWGRGGDRGSHPVSRE